MTPSFFKKIKCIHFLVYFVKTVQFFINYVISHDLCNQMPFKVNWAKSHHRIIIFSEALSARKKWMIMWCQVSVNKSAIIIELLTVMFPPMVCAKFCTTLAVYTTSKRWLNFAARFEMFSNCSLTDATVVSLTTF